MWKRTSMALVLVVFATLAFTLAGCGGGGGGGGGASDTQWDEFNWNEASWQ